MSRSSVGRNSEYILPKYRKSQVRKDEPKYSFNINDIILLVELPRILTTSTQ
jgi:hypothetical protein